MQNEIRLKDFREMFQLTQKQAGESIGIDQRQWNRYENGINEMPVRYIRQLCTKHNVDANWLLGLKD